MVLVEKMTVVVKQCTVDGQSEVGMTDPKSEIEDACVAFSNLIHVVKEHDKNQAVLVSAVKWGGKFVEQLLKV